MRDSSSVWFTSMLVLATAACGPPAGRSNGGDDDDDQTVDGGDQQFPPDDSGGSGCQKIDLLFVIDNSGSMGQEQANLIANFPQFITVLDQSGLDYRVAVTTTSVDYHYQMSFPVGGNIPQNTGAGEDGSMIKPATCNMTRRWIEKNDPMPAQTFSCVANVGTGGNSDEMPLAAMRTAFEERMADMTNAGFHRSDALLGIVFLTDEDDCSYEQSVTLGFSESLCENQMEPATNYVSFLDTYTGNRTRWAAAAIAGMGPGSCTSTFGDAVEATRLKAFVAAAGSQARMSSICDGDLSVSLQQTLALFTSACGGIIF
jgi:hypothetical protein